MAAIQNTQRTVIPCRIITNRETPIFWFFSLVSTRSSNKERNQRYEVNLADHDGITTLKRSDCKPSVKFLNNGGISWKYSSWTISFEELNDINFCVYSIVVHAGSKGIRHSCDCTPEFVKAFITPYTFLKRSRESRAHFRSTILVCFWKSNGI